ncbi:MAG: ComEC/Rec2 family competence protein [Muribaculaceae bacterium]|nr:ComEC/Rec2 family competence protein [Muribaculaceae bacterium]
MSRNPALRLLIPFAAGIIVASIFGTSLMTAIVTAIAGAATYAAMTWYARTPARRLALQPWWIIPVAIITIATGMATTAIHRPATLALEDVNGHPAEAIVDDVLRKDFSMTITATMLQPSHAKILLTTRGCDYSLTAGEHIYFHCNLSPITNMGNPDETDYALQMRRKGIIYRQHLDACPSHHQAADNPRLTTRLNAYRYHLENVVMNTPTSAFTQQLIIAMLLGDSRVIDPQVREEFSQAGVAHVLALSGLHVGILVWIVWLLLWPLDRMGRKKLRLALTMMALVIFDIFTGLSPSVLRASLMIGMAFSSYILFRRYAPLNTLAVAALLILLFSPYQLFSIGFQLSFITVAALLVTYSHISFNRHHPIVNYVLATLLTTMVAMLATLMLNAYYFHTVSLISVVANLLVVPLVPVIIILGTLVLVLTTAGVTCQPLYWLTDRACELLHRINDALNTIPAAHIDNIYLNGGALLLYLLALLMVMTWLATRRRSLLLVAAVSVVAMAATIAVNTWRTPGKGLVVFNDFKTTPILGFDQGQAVLWIPDEEEDPELLKADFTARHKAFLAHYHINDMAVTTHADVALGNMLVKPPFASFGDTRVMAIDDKGTATTLNDDNPPIHLLVLGRHIKRHTDKLPSIANIPLVVVSGAGIDVPQSFGQQPQVHDITRQGAYVNIP